MDSPPMRLVSVNVSLPREVSYRGRTVWTGIHKKPVSGRVRAGFLNLDGDRQADRRYHGGPDKALYAYDRGNARFWEEKLGREMPPGQFGENLTVEGMSEGEVHIGDRFRIGTAVVEVSEPRAPCFKLGLAMGSQRFVKEFLESGRIGFYLRVLEEGGVSAGDAIERLAQDEEKVTILEATRFLFFENADPAAARRALRIPSLSGGLRRAFTQRLAAGGS